MINIQNKQDCCGCSACLQKCPKQCISLHEDKEGFLYPKVDLSVCIDCGLCERVCPVLNQSDERVPLEIFAAKNPNEQIRKESSSGGIFTMLAESTIDAGGVVFGVKWNEHFEAVHAYTETKEGLGAFRGSKYVQSQVGETFKQAEQFLKQGRQVLYSGTPCQIAALKLYLRKDYENLLTVDIICHGAPSPGVFRWYLSEELTQEAARQSGKKIQFRSSLPIPSIAKADVLACEQGFEIEDIRFRDKCLGWAKFSFVLSLKSLSKVTTAGEKNSVSLSYSLYQHVFLRGFLNDLYLRPSCHDCPSKSGKSKSDITLADYWGIYSIIPTLADDKGVSAVVVNSKRGASQIKSLGVKLYEVPISDLLKKNPAFAKSTPKPNKRHDFFNEDSKNFHEKIESLCKVTFKRKFKRMVKDVLFGIFGAKTLGHIKILITR